MDREEKRLYELAEEPYGREAGHWFSSSVAEYTRSLLPLGYYAELILSIYGYIPSSNQDKYFYKIFGDNLCKNIVNFEDYVQIIDSFLLDISEALIAGRATTDWVILNECYELLTNHFNGRIGDYRVHNVITWLDIHRNEIIQVLQD